MGLGLPSNPNVGQIYTCADFIDINDVENIVSMSMNASAAVQGLVGLLKRTVPWAAIGTMVLKQIAQAIIDFKQLKDVRGYSVRYTFKYRKMTCWDTDEWVETVGWDLLDTDVVEVK